MIFGLHHRGQVLFRGDIGTILELSTFKDHIFLISLQFPVLHHCYASDRDYTDRNVSLGGLAGRENTSEDSGKIDGSITMRIFGKEHDFWNDFGFLRMEYSPGRGVRKRLADPTWSEKHGSCEPEDDSDGRVGSSESEVRSEPVDGSEGAFETSHN